jgi:predicted transcriptional regulator
MPVRGNEKVAALPSAAMASPTATIRIPKETRDRLAVLAKERGVSLSVLLTEWAQRKFTREEREAAIRSEQEAGKADAENPEALAEYRLWEATLEDGIDFD